MENNLLVKLRSNPSLWQELLEISLRADFPPRTTLLENGAVARNIYLIESGCLRTWFDKQGKDITFQFFFEGQGVASISSFRYATPSAFSIETVEFSVVRIFPKEAVMRFFGAHPELNDVLFGFLFGRFENYAQLFLSRIRDTPRERYEELIRTHPEIFRRVPQHYIASYLGITSVSLSRIRNRK